MRKINSSSHFSGRVSMGCILKDCSFNYSTIAPIFISPRGNCPSFQISFVWFSKAHEIFPQRISQISARLDSQAIHPSDEHSTKIPNRWPQTLSRKKHTCRIMTFYAETINCHNLHEFLSICNDSIWKHTELSRGCFLQIVCVYVHASYIVFDIDLSCISSSSSFSHTHTHTHTTAYPSKGFFVCGKLC